MRDSPGRVQRWFQSGDVWHVQSGDQPYQLLQFPFVKTSRVSTNSCNLPRGVRFRPCIDSMLYILGRRVSGIVPEFLLMRQCGLCQGSRAGRIGFSAYVLPPS